MLKKIYEKISNSEGFTLIEILIAMAIFGIALLGIIQVFYYSMLTTLTANRITTSANLAKKEMDTIRLMSIDEIENIMPDGTKNFDIDNDGSNDYIFEYTINKQTLPVGSGYTKYVVTVTMRPQANQGGARKGRELTYNLRSVLLRNPNDQN